MNVIEVVRPLYEYNEWANGHVLAAAAALSPAEFAEPRGTSFGSVEANLAHIIAGQVIWLTRWTAGSNPRGVLEEQDIHGHDAIRDAFGKSHAALRSFLDELSEERLGGTLDYRDSAGNEYHRPLWQLMLHLENHGTHHRAETAMALTEMGHPPHKLDYAYFELGRASR